MEGVARFGFVGRSIQGSLVAPFEAQMPFTVDATSFLASSEARRLGHPLVEKGILAFDAEGGWHVSSSELPRAVDSAAVFATGPPARAAQGVGEHVVGSRVRLISQAATLSPCC